VVTITVLKDWTWRIVDYCHLSIMISLIVCLSVRNRPSLFMNFVLLEGPLYSWQLHIWFGNPVIITRTLWYAYDCISCSIRELLEEMSVHVSTIDSTWHTIITWQKIPKVGGGMLPTVCQYRKVMSEGLWQGWVSIKDCVNWFLGS
jgi:hypothetical protein